MHEHSSNDTLKTYSFLIDGDTLWATVTMLYVTGLQVATRLQSFETKAKFHTVLVSRITSPAMLAKPKKNQ